MNHINDFFISHLSEDGVLANALADLLHTINPDWRVFLDCSEEHPLESHEDWCARMLQEVAYSRYLIFVASSAEYLKDGNGWLYEEVSAFQKLKATRNRRNAGDRTLGYFGILFGKIDFERELYSHPKLGSDYRRIYDQPEHLVLEEGDTISSAAERIRNKIRILTESSDLGTAAELLDKTRQFAEEKRQQDPMFDGAAICDELLPFLKDEDHRLLQFSDVCDAIAHGHVAILGNEGGSGKTTLLTKLFYHFSDSINLKRNGPSDWIPFYVDAKNLAADNYLILRYLARHLYGDRTAMTDRFTGESIGVLDREFSMETESPRYLLLIDGYNEIPQFSLELFNRELEEFLPGGRYKNVRVVIAGRYLNENLLPEHFYTLRLNELKEEVIIEYLSANGVNVQKLSPALSKILSIPMYLRLYAQTAADRQIQTKGELLGQFVTWQHEKDTSGAENDEQKALFGILFHHLLPFVAHRMVMTAQTRSDFVITAQELEDIFCDVPKLFGDTEYKRYYGKDYRDALRLSRMLDYDELDLSDLASEYFVHTCKLFRKNAENGYEFIHQIYRDFFCAKFVAEELCRAASSQGCPHSLEQTRLEDAVKEFVCELLQEGRPFFDDKTLLWDYSCNDTSVLFQLPHLIRAHQCGDNGILVSNAVELLKYARQNDFSSVDFSYLNLTESNLVTGIFFRQDQNGRYSANFHGATIHRNNLFSEHHFAQFRGGAVKDGTLAVIDADGILKFWQKEAYAMVPKKVITGVDYEVSQLLFSRSGDVIYARTAHEILEIPIPQEAYSNARPKLLYETTKRLRNIRLGEDGEIYFTTAFNAFNEKPVSNPDAPDIVDFYGLNSAAAVNSQQTRLAYGNITGYPGLKLYDLNPETKEWEDRRIGFSRLLDLFMKEFEGALRKFKLYMIFPHDNARTAKRIETRRSYFNHLQLRFESTTHDQEKVPEKIAVHVLRDLTGFGIELRNYQQKKLDSIVKKYEGIILKEKAENFLLFFLSGRKITALDFKPGTDTLLVSCMNQFVDDTYAHSLVLELDTNTLATRFVTRFSGHLQPHAFYSDGKIVVNGDVAMTVSDEHNSNLMRVDCYPNKVEKFLHQKGTDFFYAIAPHVIYSFSENGCCTGSVNNFFRTVELYFCVDDQEHPYLIRRTDYLRTRNQPDNLKYVLDMVSLEYRRISGPLFKRANFLNTVVIGDKSFKMCTDKLTTFCRELRTDSLEICYKLFVCGCDFREVKGNIQNSRDLRLLSRFGGLTEDYTAEECLVLPEIGSFVPSEVLFAVLEEEECHSLFSHVPDTRLTLANLYKEAQGGDNMYSIKIWRKIHMDSYSKQGLEAADYSILEWVNRLMFATPKMITNLITAGLIEAPASYGAGEKNIEKRMFKVLHASYRLLCRYVFYHIPTKVQHGTIYTTSKTFGANLLRKTTDEEVFVQENYAALDTVETNRILSLNQWLCTELARYGKPPFRYGLRTRFDAANHFNGRAKIHGYLKFGEQALFAQSFRLGDSDSNEADIAEKVSRMALVATHYQHLTRDGMIPEPLERPPVLVLIGESCEHCFAIARLVEAVAPHIRKLFTYDTLLTDPEAAGDGNYFELVSGEPRRVRLSDIIS
ncbi:MAG: hypothetical protein J6A61_03665 [Clostridia bacterium]|nr:hypothetical protein [Clostridia bacterium]